MPVMRATTYANAVHAASEGNSPDGEALAQLVRHTQVDRTDAPHVTDLWKGLPPTDHNLDNQRPSYITAYSSKLAQPWLDMAVHHTAVIVSLKQPPHTLIAFERQHELVNQFYRWLVNSTANEWSLPVLYAVCYDLKRISEMADDELVRQGLKPAKLEQASRLLQKCFSACLNDRAMDIARSRKMGTYYMAVLLFKTYFKLKSTALCKNLVKGIQAAELPSLRTYPKAHQVAYNYYLGVFAFLREDYVEAEAKFLASLEMIHRTSHKNIEFILDYLIPILLLRGVMPSTKVLKNHRHARVFVPFINAITVGDVRGYDDQLRVAEKRLMERGTYLVVERARENAVRTLLKKAWILEGKPTRMPIAKFKTVYNIGADQIDSEEVECLLANMIYKGLIKGYIAHGPQIVVLAKDKPFPWYAPFKPLSTKQKAEREARESAERLKPVPPLANGNTMDTGN